MNRMKEGEKYKRISVQGISLIFTALFTYAAVSKLLILQDFKIQLEHFPFLGQYAGILVWLIPGSLILITALFIFPGLKILALYTSLLIMLLFSSYILGVLNFAESIPCSCAGIASLSWKQHLILNLGLLLLAGVGIRLEHTFKSA